MQTFDLKQTENAWSNLASNVFVPHTDKDYQQLITILDNLIDEVGENESHPLASLIEVIGVLIENYETQHVPESAVSILINYPTPLN